MIYVVGFGVLLSTLVVIGSVIVLIFKVGKWFQATDQVKRDLGSIKETLAKVVEEFRDDIKKIFLYLRPEVSSSSPLELTDFGRELSTDIGGQEWARQKASELASRVRGQPAFEVHEFAAEYVQGNTNFDEAFFQRMRECVYNRGAKIEQIRNVLAVELRDALLKNLPDA